MLLIFCSEYGHHRYLHVLTHYFPTRRSSDLRHHHEVPQRALRRVPAIAHHWRPGLVPRRHPFWPQPGAAIAQRQVVRGKGGGLRGLVVNRVEVRLQAVHQRNIEPVLPDRHRALGRSEEHTSELQSLMRISYAVFCLKKKKTTRTKSTTKK